MTVSKENTLRRIVGACGVLCEACPLFRRRENRCLGCVEYNERCAKEGKTICKFYACAKRKSVGMCFYCDEFPCTLHYEDGIYTTRILNLWKSLLGKE
ncbi:MAG: DUF3795 domain-containing protein [Candidatus Baldrarchaeia archaeon]